MKSVQNLISYLHEFFWNFSQFVALNALSGPRAGIPTALRRSDRAAAAV
jgi:hypothetical protein